MALVILQISDKGNYSYPKARSSQYADLRKQSYNTSVLVPFMGQSQDVWVKEVAIIMTEVVICAQYQPIGTSGQ